MILLIDQGRLKSPWLALMLLASLILLTGATWYFTPNSGSRLVGVPTNVTVNLDTVESLASRSIGRGSEQAPAAPASSTFAPFLTIVPSESGTELFISAGGTEVGGEVVANVAIGGGSHKGGTMTYSNTVQSYVITMYHDDLQMGESREGNLFITTTLGLNTGGVDFNRAYVPLSPTPGTDITSPDNILKLTLLNADTFPAEAYVAVVPSFAPPGPPPLGHRIIGSVYSVRASGALPTTNKPFSLDLSYNETLLTGANPHTLAIFAWDAFNQRWDNLGGRLFYDPNFPNDLNRNRVSVTSSLFTTYALMAAPTWRDEFDEFSGLDFSQFNNVTFGGTPGNRTLILASTPGSGSAVSQPITPTTAITSWNTLIFSRTVDPPTTTLTVDILNLDGTEVLTNVTSGASLAGLDPAQYPALKLHVNMASTMAGQTPSLERWELSWQVVESQPPGQNTIYLPVMFKE